MELNGDLVTDILGRVDGITLANAGCVSSQFWSIAKEENIWEEKCSSLWPSTEDPDIKKFISSSLGGFRNFYANCFPVIAYDESSERDKMKVCDGVPSDFVSLVDVVYQNKTIYSKVVWGIPCAEEAFDSWFCNCPFKMGLINFYDIEDEDQTTSGDELPTIDPLDRVKTDWNFWGQLTENIRLSWIMINKRTGEAANLSSWSPLSEQSHWASHKEFVIPFGSILPAHSILYCKSVQCILVIKCTFSDSLKITELSMRLEDTRGVWVNGRESLLILERALGCRRSNNQIQIFESYQKHLSEQGKLKEPKTRDGGGVDIITILSALLPLLCFGISFSGSRHY